MRVTTSKVIFLFVYYVKSKILICYIFFLSKDLLLKKCNFEGFRYELYCASKCHKTTQCTVECDISKEKAWELNDLRTTEKYAREAFDALCNLYEPPIYNNRFVKRLRTVEISIRNV